MKDNILQVRIMSATKDIYVGEADSVSSINSMGTFDVLPGHAKFVTLVENNSIIVRSVAGEKKFDFSVAIFHVHDNVVNVYTDPVRLE